MSKIYVLFNPLAGNNDGELKAKKLENLYSKKEMVYKDITKINDYSGFVEELGKEDQIVVCGGDGTLNRFVNDTYNLNIRNNILYYATGNGNDFLRDLGKSEGANPFRINNYIKNLPSVTVNGETRYFLNGVGFGIDGFCCEVGDDLREKGKKPNYTNIAVKGLLHGYKPTSATVIVDGQKKTYKKVWIAPTMYGRFYGGGMMPAPKQSRNNSKRLVSFAAVHNSGKLRTLYVFPSIFKGTHINRYTMVDVIKGHNITVKFDRPSALQIDGETISGVTEYQVQSAGVSRTDNIKRAACKKKDF